jgi:polar amino acid transport system substrate-binding protein
VLAPAATTAARGAGGDGTGGTSGAPTTGAAADTVPAVTKDDRLAALVPDAVKADGKIVVGQDQSTAPTEFVDNGKVTGFDVDLGTAAGQRLGQRTEFQNVDFSGIIAALAAGKYERSLSSLNINDERLNTVDMVSYYQAGIAAAVLAGPDPLGLDRPCGKTVATQKGTVEVNDLQHRSTVCTDAQLPAIDLTQLPSQTEANLALTAHRAQAMFADSPVVDYAIKQNNGALRSLGAPYDSAPYGIALKKGQGTFAKAVRDAVQSLIDDGTLKKIRAKWGMNPVGAREVGDHPPS